MKYSRWPVLAFASVAAVFFHGCFRREEVPGIVEEARTVPGRPDTVAVLRFMPESAAIAIAIPSIESVNTDLESFLIRGAPDHINMEAEIKVVVRQLARNAEAFDAQTVEDIALAKGIDPGAPLGVFFPAEDEYLDSDTAAQRPFPGTDMGPFSVLPGSMSSFVTPLLAFSSRFAVVLPVINRQDAEQLVSDWGGGGTMNPNDVSDLGTTIFTRTDGHFAYFFTKLWLVAGTDPMLVNEIAGRMTAPAVIRYGTDECPADADDEMVLLIRLDRLTASYQGRGESAGSGWYSPLVGPLAAAYTGDDPIVVTWKFDEDHLTVRSRLDYDRHPRALELAGQPRPLALPGRFPASTLAFSSFSLGDEYRAHLKTALTGPEQSQSALAPVAPSLTKLIDAMGNEIAMAVTGMEGGNLKLALLARFNDGDAARAALNEMGMLALKDQTYNNTDLYAFFFPMPSMDQIRYAIPGNTFVIATDLNLLKTLVDSILSERNSGLMAALEPPLDGSAPRRNLLVARKEFFSDAFVPLLASTGMISAEQREIVAHMFDKLRDARLTTEVHNNWMDNRLVVQLD